MEERSKPLIGLMALLVLTACYGFEYDEDYTDVGPKSVEDDGEITGDVSSKDSILPKQEKMRGLKFDMKDFRIFRYDPTFNKSRIRFVNPFEETVPGIGNFFGPVGSEDDGKPLRECGPPPSLGSWTQKGFDPSTTPGFGMQEKYKEVGEQIQDVLSSKEVQAFLELAKIGSSFLPGNYDVVGKVVSGISSAIGLTKKEDDVVKLLVPKFDDLKAQIKALSDKLTTVKEELRIAIAQSRFWAHNLLLEGLSENLKNYKDDPEYNTKTKLENMCNKVTPEEALTWVFVDLTSDNSAALKESTKAETRRSNLLLFAQEQWVYVHRLMHLALACNEVLFEGKGGYNKSVPRIVEKSEKALSAIRNMLYNRVRYLDVNNFVHVDQYARKTIDGEPFASNQALADKIYDYMNEFPTSKWNILVFNNLDWNDYFYVKRSPEPLTTEFYRKPGNALSVIFAKTGCDENHAITGAGQKCVRNLPDSYDVSNLGQFGAVSQCFRIMKDLQSCMEDVSGVNLMACASLDKTEEGMHWNEKYWYNKYVCFNSKGPFGEVSGWQCATFSIFFS
jgi:hypothetical protein